MRFPSIDEWVAELRNPDVKQGRKVLRNSEGEECCLGVHCRLAELPFTEQRNFIIFLFDDSQYCTYPPHELMEEYGMNRYGLPLVLGDQYSFEGSLSELNDLGSSFHKIAEVLIRWKEEGLIHDPRS